jgi:hypothetical protein
MAAQALLGCAILFRRKFPGAAIVGPGDRPWSPDYRPSPWLSPDPAPRYRRGHFELEMPTAPTPANAPTPPKTCAHPWIGSLRRLVSIVSVVGIALLGLGCKAAYGTSAPEGGYYDYDGYPSTGDDYAEGGVARDYVMLEESSRASGKSMAGVEARREFRDHNAAAPAPAQPAEPAPPPVAEPAPTPTTPAITPTPTTSKRQIIYTATMQVRVFDVEHAIAVAEALPERLGGWLHQRSDTQLILRIPAERLEQAMAEIAELGIVDYRLLDALDVTAQYTDLDSRIRVLEQMQAQLEALLARAKDVEQALAIRRALDEVTLELEAARAHMRELAKSIAFSTLVLRFVEQGPGTPTPTRNDPFGWVDELGVEATEFR